MLMSAEAFKVASASWRQSCSLVAALESLLVPSHQQNSRNSEHTGGWEELHAVGDVIDHVEALGANSYELEMSKVGFKLGSVPVLRMFLFFCYLLQYRQPIVVLGNTHSSFMQWWPRELNPHPTQFVFCLPQFRSTTTTRAASWCGSLLI